MTDLSLVALSASIASLKSRAHALEGRLAAVEISQAQEILKLSRITEVATEAVALMDLSSKQMSAATHALGDAVAELEKRRG